MNLMRLLDFFLKKPIILKGSIFIQIIFFKVSLLLGIQLGIRMLTLLIHGPRFDPHNQKIKTKIKTKQKLYKLSLNKNWLKDMSDGLWISLYTYVVSFMHQSSFSTYILFSLCPYMKSDYYLRTHSRHHQAQ